VALVFFAAVSYAAPAQVSITMQSGKPQKAVVGLPFSADQNIRCVQHLSNGMPLTHQMSGHVYRSADGLERYDGTFPSTDSTHPEPGTLAVILDPVKHIYTLLNSALMTASVTHTPENTTVTVAFLAQTRGAGTAALKPEDMTITDLGKRTQDRLALFGKRITSTIPAGKIGNEQPLLVTLDAWSAPELKIVVSEVQQDPLAGERTFSLTNIRSEEPDPGLFQVPEGYTVKSIPAGISSVAGRALAPPPLPDPMVPEIEAARNSLNAGLKDELAYKLANLNVDIPQAESLAEDAISIEEKQLSDFSLPANPAAFSQMIVLSRFWNTIGLIYFREKKYQLAETYTRAAWELDPMAFVGNHLGRYLQCQHRTAEATTAYLMALSLPASDQERAQIQTRLAELGVTSVQPQPVSIATPLPSLLAAIVPSGNGPLVDILLSHGDPPAVSFLRGDPALKDPVTQAIQSALAGALPDAGPEKVVRRAQVNCDAGSTPACVLHFFTSREAKLPQSTPETFAPLF
jgi:tetratricopeptide (TPR) repeat protein